MKKVILENDLLIYLLIEDKPLFIEVVKSVKTDRLSLHFSKETLVNLLSLVKAEYKNSKISLKTISLFQRFISDSCKFTANVSTANKGFDNKNKYINLYERIDADYLIALSYQDYSILEGFQGINVVDYGVFFRNIKSSQF